MIESLEPKHFENLTELYTLRLQNNKLRTLPEGIFDSLPNLYRVYLNDNPWHCDCNLISFSNWMKADIKKIRSLSPETCESPDSLKGQHLKSLTEDQLICLTTPATTTALPLTTVTSTTVAITTEVPTTTTTQPTTIPTTQPTTYKITN